MIGLDPAGFSLRELELMAGERKRVAGELAAWHIAMIAGMFGTQLSPTDLNPYRVVSEKEQAARAKQEKAKFWANLEIGWFGKRVLPPKET